MNHSPGYTILELMAVLTIMALIVAAVPGMDTPGVETLRFYGKVSYAKYKLQIAHENAVERNQIIRLNADDLERSDLIYLKPNNSITFFPDGSADNSMITITFGGHSRNIIVNPLTGSIEIR